MLEFTYQYIGKAYEQYLDKKIPSLAGYLQKLTLFRQL
ncbi:hypothetical protein PAUR_a1605 [Pseudoalteromonas aurantia 208]|uniref:Orphan protein n=1 Tax=Pseudoalteromonas aurantia 208 TaxID=1314867 RepID=A0ABR9EAR5_9GAMM|nr:hypothetical protein [Pseudoalteromonas aurantia 208]